MKKSIIISIVTLFVIVLTPWFAQSAEIKVSEVNKTGRELIGLIKAEEFAQVEEKFDALLKEKPINTNGRSVLTHLYWFIGQDRNIISALDVWCARPDAAHSAFISRGSYYITDAWRSRGGGWAYTVREDGWRGFKTSLNKAKSDLEKAYKMNPSDPESAALMITVCMGLGLSEETMEQWFERTVKADPLWDSAYEQKLCYLFPKWHGTEEKATKFANYCYENSPPGSRIYLVKAYNLKEMLKRSSYSETEKIQTPEYQEMMKIHYKFLEDFPNSPSGRRRLARLKRKEKKYDEAITLCTEAINIDPVNDVFDERGENYYWKRDFENARKDFLEAIELDTTDAKAWNMLGRIELYGYKQYQKSLDYFNKAIEFKPTKETYYYRRGLSYKGLRKYLLAIKDFTTAIQIDSRYARAYLCRGQVYWLMEKYDLAEEDFESANELKPELSAEIEEFKRKNKWRTLKHGGSPSDGFAREDILTTGILVKFIVTILIMGMAIGVCFIKIGFDKQSQLQTFLVESTPIFMKAFNEDGSLKKYAKILICAWFAFIVIIVWIIFPNN